MLAEYDLDKLNPRPNPYAEDLRRQRLEDTESYKSNPENEIQVTDAIPFRGGMMLVTFSTGEKRVFDTKLLQGSAFEPLADEKIFMHPSIFHGVITWNNGEIDIAPETVYKNSTAY